MVSEVYSIDTKKGFAEILDEVARTAEYCRLSQKDCNMLRLLAEELLGLTGQLLQDTEAVFWMEKSDNTFTLHVKTRGSVSVQQKESLLTVSKSGKNASAKGLLGKISEVFNTCMMEDTQLEGMVLTTGNYGLDRAWSMAKYCEKQSAKEQKEAWDGLERSILLNYADDILIGVKSHQAEMTVIKNL